MFESLKVGRIDDLETYTARVISIVYSERDSEKTSGAGWISLDYCSYV